MAKKQVVGKVELATWETGQWNEILSRITNEAERDAAFSTIIAESINIIEEVYRKKGINVVCGEPDTFRVLVQSKDNGQSYAGDAEFKLVVAGLIYADIDIDESAIQKDGAVEFPAYHEVFSGVIPLLGEEAAARSVSGITVTRVALLDSEAGNTGIENPPSSAKLTTWGAILIERPERPKGGEKNTLVHTALLENTYGDDWTDEEIEKDLIEGEVNFLNSYAEDVTFSAKDVTVEFDFETDEYDDDEDYRGDIEAVFTIQCTSKSFDYAAFAEMVDEELQGSRTYGPEEIYFEG